jgi:transcriptional regulator with XRE-family HTH domain
MQDISKNNSVELIKEFGKIIREHRLSQKKTIYGISAECAMSKSTWREAEIGACKDIKFTTIWKIAEGLGLEPAKLLEELKVRLGKNFSLTGCDD